MKNFDKENNNPYWTSNSKPKALMFNIYTLVKSYHKCPLKNWSEICQYWKKCNLQLWYKWASSSGCELIPDSETTAHSKMYHFVKWFFCNAAFAHRILGSMHIIELPCNVYSFCVYPTWKRQPKAEGHDIMIGIYVP